LNFASIIARPAVRATASLLVPNGISFQAPTISQAGADIPRGPVLRSNLGRRDPSSSLAPSVRRSKREIISHRSERLWPPKQKDRPKTVSASNRAHYILSPVFFILADLDFFFLLIVSFDISPFVMLSLCAAGPVVAGAFVPVD